MRLEHLEHLRLPAPDPREPPPWWQPEPDPDEEPQRGVVIISIDGDDNDE